MVYSKIERQCMYIRQKILSNIKKIFIVVSIFIFSYSSLALASPKLKQIFRYYGVTGMTKEDIIFQLNTKGPVKYGQRYRAYTSWNIEWDHKVELRGGKCYLNSINTTLNVSFRLPHWANRDKAPKELSDKWDLYIKNLTNHEYGHRDYGMAAAVKIEKDLKNVPPQDTCESFQAELKKEAKAITNNAHLMEAEYDLKTQHGRTQGAFFE